MKSQILNSCGKERSYRVKRGIKTSLCDSTQYGSENGNLDWSHIKAGNSPSKKRTYSEEAPTIDTISEEKEMSMDIETKKAAIVTHQGYIVHRCGMNNNKVVAQVTLAELLLLSHSKGTRY